MDAAETLSNNVWNDEATEANDARHRDRFGGEKRRGRDENDGQFSWISAEIEGLCVTEGDGVDFVCHATVEDESNDEQDDARPEEAWIGAL